METWAQGHSTESARPSLCTVSRGTRASVDASAKWGEYDCHLPCRAVEWASENTKRTHTLVMSSAICLSLMPSPPPPPPQPQAPRPTATSSKPRAGDSTGANAYSLGDGVPRCGLEGLSQKGLRKGGGVTKGPPPPFCRPPEHPHGPGLPPAEGEQERAPHSFPRTRGSREVAAAVGSARPGSVGPGRVGMARGRLSPQPGILGISQGSHGVRGTSQGLAHPWRGGPSRSPVHRKARRARGGRGPGPNLGSRGPGAFKALGGRWF